MQDISEKYDHCTKDNPLLKISNLEFKKCELKYQTYGEILQNSELLEFKWNELKVMLAEINAEISKINKSISDGQLKL